MVSIGWFGSPYRHPKGLDADHLENGVFILEPASCSPNLRCEDRGQWRLNATDGKRCPYPTPCTCGLGVWWFSPRRHQQLVSYPRRIGRRLAWSCRPADEAVRATWPALTL